MKRSFRIILTLALAAGGLLFLPGCEVARQARQASNLSNCDFRIASVRNVTLAGVNLTNISSLSDLGMTESARILGGFASSTFPLTLTVNLEGRNPNTSPAGLNRLEWILFIDDIQMTSGILDRAFTIQPKGTAVIPVDVSIDLKKVLTGKSAQAMINFCLNLAGIGNTPTRVKARLKPTVFVAGQPITYPGFITVSTSYSGN